MRTLSSTRAALAALLCAAACLAQNTSPAKAQVTVGRDSRVRITSPALRLSAATGTVQEVTDGSLLIQFDKPRGSVWVERGAITEMDTSVGRRHQTLKGLGIGALMGVGAGLVLGLASGDDPPDTFLAFTAEEKALGLGVALGAAGALVGVIAGAMTWSDVWSPAPVGSPPPVDVSLLPFTSERGAGLRVGVSLSLR